MYIIFEGKNTFKRLAVELVDSHIYDTQEALLPYTPKKALVLVGNVDKPAGYLIDVYIGNVLRGQAKVVNADGLFYFKYTMPYGNFDVSIQDGPAVLIRNSYRTINLGLFLSVASKYIKDERIDVERVENDLFKDKVRDSRIEDIFGKLIKFTKPANLTAEEYRNVLVGITRPGLLTAYTNDGTIRGMKDLCESITGYRPTWHIEELSETFTYITGTVYQSLLHDPIANNFEITGTRGGNPVTFKLGTDYQLVRGISPKIKWTISPSGRTPDNGTNYTITYKYVQEDPDIIPYRDQVRWILRDARRFQLTVPSGFYDPINNPIVDTDPNLNHYFVRDLYKTETVALPTIILLSGAQKAFALKIRIVGAETTITDEQITRSYDTIDYTNNKFLDYLTPVPVVDEHGIVYTQGVDYVVAYRNGKIVWYLDDGGGKNLLGVHTTNYTYAGSGTQQLDVKAVKEIREVIGPVSGNPYTFAEDIDYVLTAPNILTWVSGGLTPDGASVYSVNYETYMPQGTKYFVDYVFFPKQLLDEEVQKIKPAGIFITTFFKKSTGEIYIDNVGQWDISLWDQSVMA